MDQSLELTPKQARFCAEYFVDFNATQAALRAGYSKATAENGKLMTSPNIRQALQQRSAELNAEHELARHRVFTELEKVAFASVGDYFDEAGKPKPLHLVGADAKAALWSYNLTETDKGSSVRIRMNSKLAALEKMARHIGFYGFALENKEKGTRMSEGRSWRTGGGGQMAEVGGQQFANTDKYHPADGSPVTYEGDDEEHEADIRRWIAEAREQAIYETEQRMRAEFAALEQGTKSKEQGQEVGGGVKRQVVGEDTDNGDGGVVGVNGGVVGVKNTDFYPPAGGEQGVKSKEQGQVVGGDTDNGGPVKKRRTYTMITAKHRSKRHFDYVKIR
jgi:hypothetical protein